MPIIVSEPLGNKGKKDAKRHREKQKEAIRKKLPEIIAQESIINRKKGKIVRVPIKILEIPTFRPRRSGKGSIGVGQGKGKPGTVIGSRPGDGYGPGEPGQEPGEDYIDTEIEIEELIEMMLEDLGLPRFEEKEIRELIVDIGYKIKGITDSGPMSMLDRRRTVQGGMKRFWGYLEYLKAETGKEHLYCYRALKQASGILNNALDLIKQDAVTLEATEVEPFVILEHEDLKFRDIKKDSEKQSMAVIIAMMDVSGSMGQLKKYLSRSMLFWLVAFLRKLYDQVEIRFIIHHSTARVVDEDAFFHTGESGGTNCYAAYELARDMIETEYPTNKWNVYAWHFSDGDDGNTDLTLQALSKLIELKINMFGYGQVQPTGETWGWFGSSSNLWQKFKNYFQLQERTVNDVTTLEGNEDLPFLGVIIENREDVWPALGAFLKKDRWAK